MDVIEFGSDRDDDSDDDTDDDGEYDTDEENEAAYTERYGTETCKGIIAPKIEGGRDFRRLTKSMKKRVLNQRTNLRWSRGMPPPSSPMYRGPPPSGIEPSALVRKEDRQAILLSSKPGPLYSLSALLKSPSVQAAGVPKMLSDRAELGGLFRGRVGITEEQATRGFTVCSELFTKISAPPAVRVSSGKLCFDIGCEVMLDQLKSGFGGDVAKYLDIISDHCEISMVLLVLGTDNEERWHMDRLIGMWTKGSIGRMFLTIGTTADGKQFGFTLKDPDGNGRQVYHPNEIMFECPNGTYFLMDAIASGAFWHDHLFGLMHAGRNGGGAGGIALDLTKFKPDKSMESMLAALGDAGFLDGSKGIDITPGCIPIPKTEDMHPRAKAHGKAPPHPPHPPPHPPHPPPHVVPGEQLLNKSAWIDAASGMKVLLLCAVYLMLNMPKLSPWTSRVTCSDSQCVRNLRNAFATTSIFKYWNWVVHEKAKMEHPSQSCTFCFSTHYRVIVLWDAFLYPLEQQVSTLQRKKFISGMPFLICVRSITL